VVRSSLARSPRPEARKPKAARVALLSTLATDERTAVEEICRQIPQDGGFTMLFSSTRYDLGRLGAELRSAGRSAVGGLTSRTIGPEGFRDAGLAGFHLPARRFIVADTLIENASRFGLPDARDVVRSLRARLEASGGAARRTQFGLLLVDAEARCEERLIAALGTELAGVPIVGGSAGDFLFNPRGDIERSTRILYEDRALRGAAVFCLVAGDSPVLAINHTHYVPGRRKLVITSADPDRRLVREIDGRNAVEAYSAALGLKRPARDIAELATFPLMVRVGGQHFCRGAQRIYPNGSIEFACAMEPGLVVTLAEPRNMAARLHEMFEGMQEELGSTEIVIGFDCAARTVCMERNGMEEAIAAQMKRRSVVGFATLGEQFNTIHANNSFTCLGIAAPG
jgi:hypothetical protein